MYEAFVPKYRKWMFAEHPLQGVSTGSRIEAKGHIVPVPAVATERSRAENLP
jgi:hypothetical protein